MNTTEMELDEYEAQIVDALMADEDVTRNEADCYVIGNEALVWDAWHCGYTPTETARQIATTQHK